MLRGNIAAGRRRRQDRRRAEGDLEASVVPRLVVESQEQAVEAILNDTLKPGQATSVIRYEGPKGGPGMQEMLYPTSLPQGHRA